MNQVPDLEQLDPETIEHYQRSTITPKMNQKLNFRTMPRLPWTRFENLQYSIFLLENQKQLSTDKQRRKNKVFVLLSLFLKTKTTQQVKSHHQKMIKRYTTLQNIIKHIQHKCSKNVTVREKLGSKSISTQTDGKYLLEGGFYIDSHHSDSWDCEIQGLKLLQKNIWNKSLQFEQFQSCFNSLSDI